MLQTDADGTLMRGAVAADPVTGVRLLRSHGRSKGGAAPIWILVIPIPESRRGPDKNGYIADTQYHRFRAWALGEALEHSHAYLAKWE